MTTQEKLPDYDPRRAREGVNNKIHTLNQRARWWWQRGATVLSIGLGVLTVTLQENDAAEFIPLPVAAALATAAGGTALQKRTRLRVDSAAEDYIRSVDPLSGLEPEPGSKLDLDVPTGPWHLYTPVYSAGASACGAAGAYFLPTELIHNITPQSGASSPGVLMIAGSIVGHVLTERSIGAHERDLVAQMDAAEGGAAVQH